MYEAHQLLLDCNRIPHDSERALIRVPQTVRSRRVFRLLPQPPWCTTPVNRTAGETGAGSSLPHYVELLETVAADHPATLKNILEWRRRARSSKPAGQKLSAAVCFVGGGDGVRLAYRIASSSSDKDFPPFVRAGLERFISLVLFGFPGWHLL